MTLRRPDVGGRQDAPAQVCHRSHSTLAVLVSCACDPRLDTDTSSGGSVSQTFAREEHKPVSIGREDARAAQRDRPPREPERDRPRAAPSRARCRAPSWSRDRPDAERDPCPDRRARRGRPRDRGAGDPQGTPGRPSPVVRLEPDGAVVLALEIAVDSLAAADRRPRWRGPRAGRVDRPRGHSAVDEIVADLADLASPACGRRPAGERPSASASPSPASSAASDGVVVARAEPRLAWTCRSAIALARALGARRPDRGGQRSRPRRPRRVPPRRRRRRATTCCTSHGEVGVGGGIIVDGRPLDGRRPATAARSATCRSTRPERPAAADRSAAGRPRSARAPCCARGPPDGWRRAGRRDAARRRGRPAGGAGRARSVGRWLGVGLAGLVNILNPRLIVLGGLFGRIYPFVAALEDELDRRALAAPRRLVRVVPATLGEDAPLLGAAELAFEPLLADPAGWLVRATCPAELRPPDASAAGAAESARMRRDQPRVAARIREEGVA